MSISAVSPLLLQRYELKYLIPMELVAPISKFIEGHCEMDYYSQIASDNFYVINSLYFDTLTYLFLMRKKARIEPTFCLRVRSYGSDPRPPYYTEIKLKLNDFSNKMRAKIDVPNWGELLEMGDCPPTLDPKSKAFYNQFIYLMHTYGARPKVLTQYRRKAYLSQIDDYARVTFDRDLRYQFEEDYNVIPNDSLMTHYDHHETYPHPDRNVILELKCEKKIPLWIIQLIKKFDLTRNGFSKYGSVIYDTMARPIPAADFQPMFDHFRVR